jgi:CheY-like chemotaxis protein
MNSDSFLIYDFSLTALLKQGDVNMRRIAGEDKKLTAGEYFRMLSQFLDLAPLVSDAVKKFADNEADVKEWKNIEAMIALFQDLGCDTYIPDLYAISNARGKGDHRLAAFHANKIGQTFDDLYLRIMYAKTAKKTAGFPDADTTLWSCLKRLDEEEANRKMLVLAVDDSPAILEAVSAVLSDEYKVFKLPKPTMFENVLKQMTPELFLLDYLMPELNGFELIPIIRGFEEHKDTPIIFLTSEGTIDNVTAAIGFGVCDFIVKPFHPEQLREKVAKHIVRKNNLK